MGEFKIWISRKDNPQMSDADIARANAELNTLVNSDNQDKINAQWNKEQGIKPYGSSDST